MTATLNPEARFPAVRLQMPPIFIGVEAIILDFGPAHDGECIEVINQISPCLTLIPPCGPFGLCLKKVSVAAWTLGVCG